VRDTIYKTVRTLQTQLPFIVDAKAAGQDRLHRLRRRPHDPDFLALRSFDVDRPLVLDVGANRGQSITSFVLTCRDPEIIAFEPISRLAGRLRARDHGSMVRVEQCALGGEPAQLDIFIPVYGGYVYDGLASLDEEAAHWLNADRIYRYRPDKLELRRETVEVRTLDSYQLSPDVIKIDVQGTEDAVVAGGHETLRRSEPVLLIEAPSDELVADVTGLRYRPYAFRDGRLLEDQLGHVNTYFLTEQRVGQFSSIIAS
jgi:FkbM family methyltransferase